LQLFFFIRPKSSGLPKGGYAGHAKMIQRLSTTIQVCKLTLKTAGILPRMARLAKIYPPKVARHVQQA